MDVETAVAELLDRVAEVTELLAKQDIGEADKHAIAAATEAFGKQVRLVHSHLDDEIKKTLGDDIPLRHTSYQERDELELAVLKAKHMLELL